MYVLLRFRHYSRQIHLKNTAYDDFRQESDPNWVEHTHNIFLASSTGGPVRLEDDCETFEFQNALHAFQPFESLLLPSPCAYLTVHTLSRHLVCLPFLGRVPTNPLFSTYLRLSLVKTRPGLLPHRAHSRIALLPF